MNRLDRTQRLLACLGERSRFRVVAALWAGERCVSDLALEVGLSQSCTTRHLQALRREGLVKGTREGKRVVFRLSLENPRIAELVEWASASRDRPLPDRASPLAARRPQRQSMGGAKPLRDGEASRESREPDRANPSSTATEPEASGSEPVPENPGPPRARIRSDLEDFLL